MLLRSWVGQAGQARQATRAPAGWDGRDPQRSWLSVLDALRGTDAGSGLVQPVSAAPGLDGWTLAERLLADPAALEEPVWPVIDDVHELDPDQVLRRLKLLVMRAPPQLRLALAARHEVRLGLHRLPPDRTSIRLRLPRGSAGSPPPALAAGQLLVELCQRPRVYVAALQAITRMRRLAAHLAPVQARSEIPAGEGGHHQARHREGSPRRALGRFMEGRRMTGGDRGQQPRRYQIRICGRLGETIRSAFPALEARARGEDTVLDGVLADQAALYGVLAECEALGLELLDVRCLDQQSDHHDAAWRWPGPARPAGRESTAAQHTKRTDQTKRRRQ